MENLRFIGLVILVGFVFPLIPTFMLVRFGLEDMLPKNLCNPWLDVLTFAITAIFLLAILWGVGAI